MSAYRIGLFSGHGRHDLRLASVVVATLLLGVGMPDLVSAAERASAATVGLAARTPWTTSRLTGSPEPPSPYRVRQAFANLKFDQPVEMAFVPGTNRLVVLELMGKVLSFENRPDVSETHLAIDVTKLDKAFYRLYGIAFDPKFAENRYCYISYVLQPKLPDGSRVSRFKVTSLEPLVIDPASEEVIITWRSGGHNGACVRFGPDGCLYLSTGDGGESFPPDGLNSGQDLSELLASIVRIDVRDSTPAQPYRIPSDNPFVDLAGARGEVWAYGVRNPWKMCFHPVDGSLWVGDVGWELWEMVYRIERGGNYGWSVVEGRQPVLGQRKRGPTPVLPPTIEHSHIEARSITGGYVYRGQRLPELRGAYIYGDYVTGKIWGAWHDGRQVTEVKELVDTSLAIGSFGEDRSGEIYIVDYEGTLHELIPNPARGANQAFPKRLSETGLFASAAEFQLAPGVIPYGINAEPWSDGAKTDRAIAVPLDARLGVHEKENVQIGHVKGAWKFPSDSVLAKTISFNVGDGERPEWKRIETQILHMDGDTWKAYAYLWNDDQTDAELAPADGMDLLLQVSAENGGKRKQAWHVASRAECILCHTTRAGSIHGFKSEQLNRDFDYGRTSANQLATLDHIGLFEQTPNFGAPPAVDPYDESANLAARARSYLHVNCGHCHRRGGGGTAFIDLRGELTLEKTNVISKPTQGSFGIPDAHVVTPGEPNRSTLLYRMSKLGRGRMPYFGSSEVDPRGVELIRTWIASLPAASNVPPSNDQLLAAKLAAGSVDPSHQQATIEKCLSSTEGALALAGAVAGMPANQTRDAIVARASQHADPQVRDLFERFLPDDKRTQRIAAAINPAEILSRAGDAARGRKLLLETAGVQCKNCHRLEQSGTELGPNLSESVKKLSRGQLLESILQPSKSIDPKYMAYVVETSDGRVVNGLLAERNDTEIVLKDAANKPVRIPAAEVELLAPQPISLMPELLLKDMSAQQIADMLAYLESLNSDR
jgi:uncharacterized repeat protein (TIGR03806 family)